MSTPASDAKPEAVITNPVSNPVSKTGVLVAVCVPLLAGVLNASAVGVVLPAIIADLEVDPGRIAWLMTGFLLVYGIAIPFYGRLADLHGARRLFLAGVVIFAAGSLLAALAPSFGWLLAARVVQAVGGAAVPSLGMTLASRAYGPAARGTVLGIFGGVLVMGLIKNGLNLNNVSVFWQQILIGMIIVVAVFLDVMRREVGTRK